MYLINEDPPPEWAVFLSLNLGFPIVGELIAPIWNVFPIEVRFWIAIGEFLVLSGLNIWRWRAVPSWRRGYAAILVLNTISLFLMGSIGFLFGIYRVVPIFF